MWLVCPMSDLLTVDDFVFSPDSGIWPGWADLALRGELTLSRGGFMVIGDLNAELSKL